MKLVMVTGILTAVLGCKSFTGTRDFDRSNKDCDIQLLASLPPDKNSFSIIGTCKGRGAIMISDGSDKAYDRMIKCACQSGGDAVVLGEMRTGGMAYQEQYTNMSSFQQTSKIYTGIVIKLRQN